MPRDARLDRLEAELRYRDKELELLERVGQELARAEQPDQVLQTVVGLAGQVARCESAAVFLASGGELVPRSWSSPYATRLENAGLLGVWEPLVQDCWERRCALQSAAQPPGPERLFEGERTGAAFLLSDLGVLYAGKSDGDGFAASESRLLAMLARQAGTALASALRLEETRRASQENARIRAQLEAWSGSLHRLLEGAGEMAATLERGALLGRLETLLAQLIPHRSRRLALGKDPPLELPLLLDRAGTSRFGALLPGEESLLAAPIRHQGETLGVIALGAPEPGQFTRTQADLLSLVALHAGALLRTQSLHQQLLQSSKLAAVGQLAAGVAHELNTPLGTILLEVESLELDLEHLPAGEIRDSLARCGAEVLRAREIVEKLLIYARDARGAGWVATDLRQVVRDTLALVGSQLRRDALAVHEELGPVPPVLANPKELQQIVLNLVLNARDALQGQPRPEVRIATRVEGGAVVLRVQDNGPGVPESLRADIFDPFFTTKPVGQGTGLGLAVCRELAAAHGGTLELERSPGASFRLTLPVSVES